MLSIKRKNWTSIVLLCLGFGYFTTMSNLEVNYLLKSIIAMAPMQILALIYVTYLRFRR